MAQNSAAFPRPATHRLCIAPMMDWSDRHCRYFWRLLTRRARLYTEMVTCGALIHGDRAHLLRYNPEEQPVALQLGGSDPAELARCARLAEQWHYDEVNLNCGCPSDRVQSGQFGACLMADPRLVADCVAAMRAACSIPVTVKHRLGIDHMESYEQLAAFVEPVAAAGCRVFIVHARKAWLEGLSPRENREIPPLNYQWVHRLKRDYPHLTIVLNGGVQSLAECAAQLHHLDGVMIGRAAYQNPWLLADIDQRLFGTPNPVTSRDTVMESFMPYVRQQLAAGVRLHHMTRHVLGLYQGQRGARRFRRHLSEYAWRDGAGPEVLRAAMALTGRAAHRQEKESA